MVKYLSIIITLIYLRRQCFMISLFNYYKIDDMMNYLFKKVMNYKIDDIIKML